MQRFLTLLLCILLLPVFACAETQIITITAAGDTLLGSNKYVSTTDYAYQRYIERYGYAYPFAGVLALTATDDITLVNLEGVLHDPWAQHDNNYHFTAPVDYAKILTEGSVEIVNLANNHIMDYLEPGYLSTVTALEAEGVRYCGETPYGCTIQWFDFENDVRIGFIGIVPSYYKDHQNRVQADFQALKDAGCDVIVASLHCGREGSPTHVDIQDKYRNICMQAGANIIICTHPHVPQGLWVGNGVTMLYSLGNFTFGGNTGVNEELYSLQSMLARIDLHFDNGVYTGHQITLWPIHISGTTPHNNYQPVLVEGEAAQAIMKKVQSDTVFPLNPYIDGRGAVQDFVAWIAK